MNVDNQIASIQTQIKHLRESIKWLRSRKRVLKNLPEGTIYGSSSLDFDGLSHPEIIKVVKGLGGKWKKEKTYGKEGRVNYEQTIDGIMVRCWNGEPPPSCRLVEYEEVIPAHTVPEHVVPEQRVKKFKMVCSGVDEPAAVAIAQANQPLTNNNQNGTTTEGTATV